MTLEGVVIDPLAAEFWDGDPRSDWLYNALGGTLGLGPDANHAHVQPDETYHRRGVPTGVMDLSGPRSAAHSPLVGYAADRFTLSALTDVVAGAVTPMTSSYRLIEGDRLNGAHDGAFDQNCVYVAGSDMLGACNGAVTVAAEYPEETYAYFLSEDDPIIPRCFLGTPDDSLRIAGR